MVETVETAETPAVGGNVDSWCGKCKLVLAHTIEAMVGEKPKRVQCNTCSAQHVYKQYEPGKAPKKKKASTARKKPGDGVRASDYAKYMEGRDRSSARRYSMKSAFAVGEVVEHQKFGTGVATLRKGQNKIEILFPDGPRIMVHARG